LTSRTPPEIKWLLVERATLVGDIVRLEERKVLLEAELGRVRDLVAAVDTSIRLVDNGLRLDAGGQVGRHCPTYGRRGALKDFQIAALKAAGETGLSVRAASLLASSNFELNFASKAEFLRYSHNTVHPQLQQLRNHGLAENLSGTGPDGMLWRWKTILPTFADLALLACAAPAARVPDGQKDTAGHQVAYQRGGYVAG
jgi:hypothetical protein